jgi:iron(III) transport system ATP-binding protein
VLVTHDREEAFSLADRIALMRDGEVVQAAAPEQLYFAPADRWAARFVGEGNFLRGSLVDGRVVTPVGAFPATGANGARDVEAMVRPELLLLAPDPAGRGEVVAREFRGHDVFYRVRLDCGTSVCSQRPSTEVVPLGARVSLEPQPMAVPVFS